MRQAKTRVTFPVYPRSLCGEVEISCAKNIVLLDRLKAVARDLRENWPGLEGLAALAALIEAGIATAEARRLGIS